MNSLVDKSAGKVEVNEYEQPNITFSQERKKKVGPIRYKNDIKKNANIGKKSKKNEKKRNSATKNIEPGKPRNTSVLRSIVRNSLGHK